MADKSEVIQDYLNSLNEAMAIHAKKAVEGLEFDRTELAEIVDITNRNYGEYQVFNGSTRYFAYSENTSYTLGTKVYVTIPNNDYSQQKTIVRKYSSKEGDAGVGYVMPLSQYDPLSKNIITDLIDKDNAYQNNEAGILANYDYKELFINDEVNTDHKFPAEYSKLLYSARNLYLYQYISEESEEEAEANDEPIPSGEGEPTDESEVEETLKVKSNYQGYQYMGLSVEFKTLLPVETLISGKYGIEIAAGFVRNVEGTSAGIETQVKKYILDSSDMIGSIYNFTTYYEQQALFKLPEEGWNLDALDIYLYQNGDFFERMGNALPITDGFGELLNDNILIRNLVIRFGNEKDTGAVDKIRLYTPNGATYDAAQTNEDLNERTVRLLWTHRNPDTEAMEEMTRVSNIPNETDQRFKANIWWLRDSKHTWDEYRDELASAAEKQSEINRIAQEYLAAAQKGSEAIDNYQRNNEDKMKELIYALGFKLNKEYTYTNGYFQITQDGVRVLERSITQNVDTEHPTVTSDWGAGWIPVNETRDKFEVTFQPDIKNQTSSVRCVIEYGPWVENEDTGVEEINKDSQYYTVIYSDPLEFKNLSYIPDLTTWDASIGLTISATDKSNGHYPLYNGGADGSLLNINDGTKNRDLVADITSSYTGRSYLNGQETIIWKVPKTNTMIHVPESYLKIMDGKILNGEESYFKDYLSVIGEYDNNFWYVRYGADNDKNFYDEANYGLKKNEQGNFPNPSRNIVYNRLTYQIGTNYKPDLTNNTVSCFLIKNGTMIRASYSMTFSQHGTAGTDFTFSLGLGDLYDENWNNLDGVDSAITVNDYRDGPDGSRIDGYREIVFRLYNATNEVIELTDDQKNDIIKLWVRPESTEQIAQGCYQGANNFTKCIDTITQDNGKGKFTRVAIRTASHWVKAGIDEQAGAWVPDESKSVTLEDLRGIVLRASVTTNGVSTQYNNKKYNLNGITFTQLLPLRFKSENKYSLDASEYIIYDQHGGSPKLFNNAIILHGFDADQQGQMLELCKQMPDTNNQNILSWYGLESLIDQSKPDYYGLPKLSDDNKLIPYPIYITGIENSPCSLDVYIAPYETAINENEEVVITTELNEDLKQFVYTMPIVILQNEYQVPMFNSWDGNLLIDEENNRIMAATMAAGKKDTENRFTGVVMGDIASQNNESSEVVDTVSGLFGYHEGTQSFGFTSEGKGFIGKSGTGRIEFDGTHGWIQSANYAATIANDSSNTFDNEGTKIDLDDGSIDMWGQGNQWSYNESTNKWDVTNDNNLSTNIHLDTVGNPTKPYFRIGVPAVNGSGRLDSDGLKSLIRIDSEDYYLQTADYGNEGQGLKINLRKGEFDSKGPLTINGAPGSEIRFGNDENYLKLGVRPDGKAYFNMNSEGNGTAEQISDTANILLDLADDINAYFWGDELKYSNTEKIYTWQSINNVGINNESEFAEPFKINWYNNKGSSWIVYPKTYRDEDESNDNDYYYRLQEKLDTLTMPENIGMAFEANQTAEDYLNLGATINSVLVKKDDDEGYIYSQGDTILDPTNYIFYKKVDKPINIYKKNDETQEYEVDENNNKIIESTPVYRTVLEPVNIEDIDDYFNSSSETIDEVEVAPLYFKTYELWKEPIQEYTENVTYDAKDKVYIEDSETKEITIYESKDSKNRNHNPSDINNDIYWNKTGDLDENNQPLEIEQKELITQQSEKDLFDLYSEINNKTASAVYQKAEEEYNNAKENFNKAKNEYDDAEGALTTAKADYAAKRIELNNKITNIRDSLIPEYNELVANDRILENFLKIHVNTGTIKADALDTSKESKKWYATEACVNGADGSQITIREYLDSKDQSDDQESHYTDYLYLDEYLKIKKQKKNILINDDQEENQPDNNKTIKMNYTELFKTQYDAIANRKDKKTNETDLEKIFKTKDENSWSFSTGNKGFSNNYKLKNTDTNYMRMYDAYADLIKKRESLDKEEKEAYYHFTRMLTLDDNEPLVTIINENNLPEELSIYDYNSLINHFDAYDLQIYENNAWQSSDPNLSKNEFYNNKILKCGEKNASIEDLYRMYHNIMNNDWYQSDEIEEEEDIINTDNIIISPLTTIQEYKTNIDTLAATLKTDQNELIESEIKFEDWWPNYYSYYSSKDTIQSEYDTIDLALSDLEQALDALQAANDLPSTDEGRQEAIDAATETVNAVLEVVNNLNQQYNYPNIDTASSQNDQPLWKKYNAYKDFDKSYNKVLNDQEELDNLKNEYQAYLNNDNTILIFKYWDGTKWVYWDWSTGKPPKRLEVSLNTLIEDYLIIERLYEGISADRISLNESTVHFASSETTDQKEKDILIVNFEEPYLTTNSKGEITREFNLYTKYNNWQEGIKIREDAEQLEQEIKTAYTDMGEEISELEASCFIKLTGTEAKNIFNPPSGEEDARKYTLRTKVTVSTKYDGKTQSLATKPLITDTSKYKSTVTYYRLMEQKDFTELYNEYKELEEKIREALNEEGKYGELVEKRNEAKREYDYANNEMNKAENKFQRYNINYIPWNLVDGDYPEDETFYTLNNDTFVIIPSEDLMSYENTIVYTRVDRDELQTELISIIKNRVIQVITTTIYKKYLQKINDYDNYLKKFIYYNQGNVDDVVKLNNSEEIRLQLGSKFSVDRTGYLRALGGEMEDITVKSLNFNAQGAYAKGIVPKWMTFVTDIKGHINKENVGFTTTVTGSGTTPYSYTETITTSASGSLTASTYNNPINVSANTNNMTYTTGGPFSTGSGSMYTLTVFPTGEIVTGRYTKTNYVDVEYTATMSGTTTVPVVTSISLEVQKISMWALTNEEASPQTVVISG